MKTFAQLKAEIDEQVAATTLDPDRDVRDLVRFSISKAGCGYPQDNQIFTTWFYGTPDCGSITDWCYFLIELSYDPSYSIKQYYFTKQIDRIMDTLTRQEFVELLSAFRAYIANINVWVYHYFPWGVGYAFPRKDTRYYEEALALCE